MDHGHVFCRTGTAKREVCLIFVQNMVDTVYEILPTLPRLPNVGSKAAAYTAVALRLLTWRIW